MFPDSLQAEAVDTDTRIQQMIKNSEESIDMEIIYLPPITTVVEQEY